MADRVAEFNDPDQFFGAWVYKMAVSRPETIKRSAKLSFCPMSEHAPPLKPTMAAHFDFVDSCPDDSYTGYYLMFFLQKLIIFSPFLTNPLHILKTLSKFIAIVNEGHDMSTAEFIGTIIPYHRKHFQPIYQETNTYS
jgi:hypothetical protein